MSDFAIWHATYEAIHKTQDPAKCDSSYPDMCISISHRHNNEDLDCGDLFILGYQDCFRVRGDDFHNFDADGDGIGCEEYCRYEETEEIGVRGCEGLECP